MSTVLFFCHMILLGYTSVLLSLRHYSLFNFFFKEKKRKYEPPVPTRVGKKKKRTRGPDAATKLPQGVLDHFSYYLSDFRDKIIFYLALFFTKVFD